MQAISTKYLGPTDNRGSRIKATSESGESITVPYSHELRDGAEVHSVAAIALCRKLGWNGTLIAGATKDGYVFVFEHSDRFDIGLDSDEARAIREKRYGAILNR